MKMKKIYTIVIVLIFSKRNKYGSSFTTKYSKDEIESTSLNLKNCFSDNFLERYLPKGESPKPGKISFYYYVKSVKEGWYEIWWDFRG